MFIRRAYLFGGASVAALRQLYLQIPGPLKLCRGNHSLGLYCFFLLGGLEGGGAQSCCRDAFSSFAPFSVLLRESQHADKAPEGRKRDVEGTSPEVDIALAM